MDWASQPNPFRSFRGAPETRLAPRPDAAPGTAIVGDLLRHALGLSAWKHFRGTRWSLRVNPSSGNLHPTEAYVIAGAGAGLGDRAGVFHYAPDRHVLEQRCAFDAVPEPAAGTSAPMMWIALTSIHWREAWKYGERAFRYCQHDLGHAIAAVRFAAANLGLRATMAPHWPQRDIASLTGIDRDDDYVEAEREEAGCLIAVSSRQSSVVSPQSPVVSREALLTAVRAGRWTGQANQLSEDHVQWTFIDEAARATEDAGRNGLKTVPYALPANDDIRHVGAETGVGDAFYGVPIDRALILQRRSAVALDGQSSITAERFFALLSQAMPAAGAPWDALWWDPRIHLALFVHRVEQVEPGLYVLARTPSAVERLKAACGREFLWDRAHPTLPLYLLQRGDCRRLAERVSCDQEIAADGFFSLGMLADFDASLAEFGESFYRHLFWESGVVGQALYLAAEAAGARGTGIGCFYDDPVHDVLGLEGHAFQSLYHFTIGMPVEDTRLSTEPGYAWEGSGGP